MWPILAIIVVLVDAATSRTESLQDLKNVQNAMPLRLNSMIRRPETDQPDKFDSLAMAGPFSEDLSALNTVKYQGGLDPFKKLSILDELDESTDERIPLIEDDDDTEIEQLSAFLAQLLQEPGGWEAPLVLVEEPTDPWEGPVIENSADGSEPLPVPWKRSRYYRRYPWKRQNSRTRYDDGSRYLCTPTREDVYRLLVALHDARQGNKSRTVNFCNRRRPAGVVFTNIRFLGRRK